MGNRRDGGDDAPVIEALLCHAAIAGAATDERLLATASEPQPNTGTCITVDTLVHLPRHPPSPPPPPSSPPSPPLENHFQESQSILIYPYTSFEYSVTASLFFFQFTLKASSEASFTLFWSIFWNICKHPMEHP